MIKRYITIGLVGKVVEMDEPDITTTRLGILAIEGTAAFTEFLKVAGLPMDTAESRDDSLDEALREFIGQEVIITIIVEQKERR